MSTSNDQNTEIETVATFVCLYLNHLCVCVCLCLLSFINGCTVCDCKSRPCFVYIEIIYTTILSGLKAQERITCI